MWMARLVLGGLAAALFGLAAQAAPLEGQKGLYLLDGSGEKKQIGTVAFNPTDNGSTYEIEWQDEGFSEHFLSMRPFRCLEGPVKYWCRVPYPYEINRVVSADDLKDLEYDTMFIWKGATEYGINMWNGIYYKLAIDGDRLVGALHEMDMDKLSAPPEQGNLRPIREQDLEPGEPESHWLPVLIIE